MWLYGYVSLSLQKVGSSALQSIELLSFRKHRTSYSCMLAPSNCISVQYIPPVFSSEETQETAHVCASVCTS
jgi:hypothetical protein